MPKPRKGSGGNEPPLLNERMSWWALLPVLFIVIGVEILVRHDNKW